MSLEKQIHKSENYDFESVELVWKKQSDVQEFEIKLCDFNLAKWILNRVIFTLALSALVYFIWVNNS